MFNVRSAVVALRRAESPPLTFAKIGERLGITKNAAIGYWRRAFPAPPHEKAAPQQPRNVFADLGPRECRWIEGDVMAGTAVACRAATAEHIAWCPAHRERVYMKSPAPTG